MSHFEEFGSAELNPQQGIFQLGLMPHSLELPPTSHEGDRGSSVELVMADAPADLVFLGDGNQDVDILHQHDSHAWDSSVEPSFQASSDSEHEQAGFERIQASSRWSSTATNGFGLVQGDPTTVTWSIALDGTYIPGFTGEPDASSNLQGFLNGIYGSMNNWLPIFESVFDRWSELSGVNFVYESQDDGGEFSNFTHINRGELGIRGDVRIGGHAIDGDYNTLGYNFSPNVGDMILDTNDSSFSDNIGDNSLWLRNLVAHESGHGLGLPHIQSSDSSLLMEPSLSTSFDGPQQGDILALHRLYGDFWESANGDSSTSNDSIASATELGLIHIGETVSIGTDASDETTVVNSSQKDFVSVDDDSDIDIFRFTINQPSAINVTLTPRGATYQEGPEGGVESTLNTKAFNDLSLVILDSSGNPLVMVNDTAAGDSEIVTGLELTSSDDYYVQVAGGDDNAQFYELIVSVTDNPDTDITLDSGDLTISDVNGGDSADRLIFTKNGDNLRITDTNSNRLGGTGISIINDETVEVPLVSLTGGIVVNTWAGNDIVNIAALTEPVMISAGEGNDQLFGGQGDDTLIGDNGIDRIRGGAGADSIDGGSGIDSIDYRTSSTGVTVNLLSDIASGGDAEGDVITNIERIYGSDLADELTGAADSNLLYGYSGNDRLSGGGGNDILRGDEGADTLEGGEGLDSVLYRTSSSGVTINLFNNTASKGDAEGDVITGVERVYGSDWNDNLTGSNDNNLLYGYDGNDVLFGLMGNDRILGYSGNDRIRGGEGSDTLDGGDGISDTVDYLTSSTGVIVNLLAETASSGDAEGDTITNFERIYGSNYDDQLTGDEVNNVLYGYGGDDTLFGGSGNDRIRGGQGADRLDGGAGSSDTVDYLTSSTGVVVNLFTNMALGGDAEGDAIANFERVYGSNHSDHLTGSDANNFLYGYAGNDIQYGLAGNDRLLGLSGNDRIRGGEGADTMDGGDGTTDTVDYLTSSAGVIVNLLTNAVSGGDAEGDTIANFERVYGSNYGDQLTGSGENNLLYGYAGDDTLFGGGGNDVMRGGDGADRLTGGSGINTYYFTDLSESLLSHYDTITDFSIGTDRLNGVSTVDSANIAHLSTVPSLNEVGIGAVLDSINFVANGAAVFTFGSGETEQTFLALNDGFEGFQSNTDAVIEITGFSGSVNNLSII